MCRAPTHMNWRKSTSHRPSPGASTRMPRRIEFNELVVVAPAHMLSELLDGLDLPANVKLLGNLAKDLVKTPDHELWPHLKEWVRPVHRA